MDGMNCITPRGCPNLVEMPDIRPLVPDSTVTEVSSVSVNTEFLGKVLVISSFLHARLCDCLHSVSLLINFLSQLYAIV